MKIIFLLVFLFTVQAFGEDKVYAVKKSDPEIVIGKSDGPDEKKRESWCLSLIRSSLDYNLPSAASVSPAFSSDLVGVSFGKKTGNQLFSRAGFYEISAEWQKFIRESNFGGKLYYSQKLNLYQLNFFQNFYVGNAFKKLVSFSSGVGVAPVYLTSEQSVFGNSTSEYGLMAMINASATFPLYKSFELAFALRAGLGAVGDKKIETASILLGLNFE